MWWVPGALCFPGEKLAEREAVHLPVSSAEVNAWSYAATPIRLYVGGASYVGYILPVSY
jgi:hypothetical protein